MLVRFRSVTPCALFALVFGCSGVLNVNAQETPAEPVPSATPSETLQEVAPEVPPSTIEAPPSSTPANVAIPSDTEQAIDVSSIAEHGDTEEVNPCIDNSDLHAWIDRLHSNLYRITCTSASWFDGLFGNRRFDEDYRASNGSMTVGPKWSQRDGIGKILRFRARVYLPQLSQTFHAFVGRTNSEQFLTESDADLYTLPDQFAGRGDEQVFVGLGYNEKLKKRGSFDADAGVRLQFPLDPYVKGSYRFARPIGEHLLFRFRETIFWQNSERFGTTGTVEFDRVLGRHFLLRWTNSGTYSQETDGIRWYSAMTLFQIISDDHALAYESFINGNTDREEPLTNYGGSVTYRQRIWRRWLLLDLRLGVDWPRYTPGEPRKTNPNAALGFELRFGRNT